MCRRRNTILIIANHGYKGNFTEITICKRVSYKYMKKTGNTFRVLLIYAWLGRIYLKSERSDFSIF
jgi:hypothetical protein